MMNLTKFYLYEIEDLSPYGGLHFLSLLLMFVAIAGFVFLAKKYGDKNTKWIVFGFGILFVCLELYKQLWFNFLCEDPEFYDWSNFPFQFCTTPMYVCLISVFFNEKYRKYLYSYLAFYGLAAGVAVMVYPNTIIIDNVSISTESLIWHGSMVVLGVYLNVVYGFGKNLKELKPAIFVFLIMVAIACTYNFVYEYFKGVYGLTDSSNMFYFSPYYETVLPILNAIKEHVPWIVFMLCYIIGVSIGALIIWSVSYLITKCYEYIKNKNSNFNKAYN